MNMIAKAFFILLGAVVATLLLFGAVQKALSAWFQIDVELVPDLWAALKNIPSAISYAFSQIIGGIGAFLASPFYAFAFTLYQIGIPYEFAQGLAIAIILGFIAIVAYGIAKWRGWI